MLFYTVCPQIWTKSLSETSLQFFVPTVLFSSITLNAISCWLMSLPRACKLFDCILYLFGGIFPERNAVPDTKGWTLFIAYAPPPCNSPSLRSRRPRLSFPAPHPASAAGSTWRTLRCPRGESFLIHHNYQRKKTPLSALWGVILSTPDSCKPETDGVNVAETERQNEKSQKQKPKKTDSLTRLQNSGPDPETTLFQD